MTDAAFEQAYAKTSGVEGGYSFDPTDPGGETIWGITVSVAREWGYVGPMKDMTRDQAKGIYYRRNWLGAGLDKIAVLSVAIASELFDSGVNCGIETAGKWLQRSLNVLNRGGSDYPDVVVDGKIGDATAKALRGLIAVRGAQQAVGVVLTALNCLQGARYIELAEGAPKLEKYEWGWLSKRVGIAA